MKYGVVRVRVRVEGRTSEWLPATLHLYPMWRTSLLTLSLYAGVPLYTRTPLSLRPTSRPWYAAPGSSTRGVLDLAGVRLGRLSIDVDEMSWGQVRKLYGLDQG